MTDEPKETGPGPQNIATISAGFEKGDFLVREEQGNRVYFVHAFFSKTVLFCSVAPMLVIYITGNVVSTCNSIVLTILNGYVGNRVYFDFFEEAFNYISNKGYSRMDKEEEKHWMELMNVIHDSVKGGMK